MKHQLNLRTFCTLLSLQLLSFSGFSQSCNTQMTFNLVNLKGGFYTNQSVILKSKMTGTEYHEKTDGSGTVVFNLPCDEVFEVNITNYAQKFDIPSPKRNGSRSTQTISYEPDMIEMSKRFEMSESDRQLVDQEMRTLPDTTKFGGSAMRRPYSTNHYTQFTLTLRDLDNGPLADEQVTMTGEKRALSFQGKTNSAGKIVFYLPKGDTYKMHFKYTRDFNKQEIGYTRGTAESNVNLMYVGTPEMERRIAEEKERIRKEEERLRKEKEAFEAWCKSKGVTVEEGHKLKLEEEMEAVNSSGDPVVTKVLDRNNWSEKLIVCDLTGSMLPYASQLSLWYKLNLSVEKNLQFVFFNDGDGKSDNAKVVGSTGGIYYQRASGLDSLASIMRRVQMNGGGGDCPENNMEALIKGVDMAGPYKELVMIVDNYAPVKDIELLKNFNRPVHIILCGAQSGRVLEDYLNIAWKTKGSIHTIEEDITKIAGMAEGQTLKVNGVEYKIMGGSFVRISGS